MLVLIKFKICGNLRFLSHAETVKVFQRACVRAGIETAYSQGFNPRPKLSLPLPRSVGVEADDDLLCLRVHDVRNMVCEIRDELSEQLPDGCELLSVDVVEANTSFQPTQATYVLAVQQEYLNERLKARVKHLLASESLNLKRRTNAGNSKFKVQNLRPELRSRDSKFKNVDVRPFLKSVELNDRAVVVECKITSAGTIRVDEILELLELDAENLAAPIRRTGVKWQ